MIILRWTGIVGMFSVLYIDDVAREYGYDGLLCGLNGWNEGWKELKKKTKIMGETKMGEKFWRLNFIFFGITKTLYCHDLIGRKMNVILYNGEGTIGCYLLISCPRFFKKRCVRKKHTHTKKRSDSSLFFFLSTFSVLHWGNISNTCTM